MIFSRSCIERSKPKSCSSCLWSSFLVVIAELVDWMINVGDGGDDNGTFNVDTFEEIDDGFAMEVRMVDGSVQWACRLICLVKG